MTGATAANVAIEVFAGLVKIAPDIMEILTGTDRKTLGERIERARLAVRDPIDPTDDDAARRAELVRIVNGE